MSKNDHCRVVRRRDLQFLSGEGDLPESSTIEALVSEDRPAFLARFPYGAEIVQQGRFQTPCQSDAKCLSCSELDNAIESSNGSIPLSLVIHGAAEAFLPLNNSANGVGYSEAPSRPMRMLGRGEFFGVFETLDAVFEHSVPPSPWGVSSGARSIFLLTSKMSDRGERWLENFLLDRHGKKRRETSGLIRIIQRDDWELVRYLVSGDSGPGDWVTEILVLPWVSRAKSAEIASALLRIAEIGWAQSRHFRGYLTVEENLVRLTDRKIHRDERIALLGVLRQILAMARGEVPAFDVTTTGAVLPLDTLRRELKGLPDRKSAIIIEPRHLQEAGDSAFASLKLNLLPALRSKAPRTFESFCHHVETALQNLSEHSIDLAETRFMTSAETLEVLVGKVGEAGLKGISSRHPFFTGCLKIVRGR